MKEITVVIITTEKDIPDAIYAAAAKMDFDAVIVWEGAK